VNNTAETRQWLTAVATKLIDRQHECGSVHEYVNATCALGFITTNAEYGNGEGGLMATNDDPVADLLYTQNFALMSLHEASHALGIDTEEGVKYAKAADALAAFLVRAQVQSAAQANLDGAWIRGMDVSHWEYWASATDSGYGPWETETGWTIGWISATLGMRRMNTTWWDTMAHASSAVDPAVVHATCMDFFEEKGHWVCNNTPPPAPPTPPPVPCLNTSVPGVAPSGVGQNATLHYNLTTTSPALCSRNGVAVRVAYTGGLCSAHTAAKVGGGGGSKAAAKKIHWKAMRTLDVPKVLRSDMHFSLPIPSQLHSQFRSL
jgi:hypothetical protein